MTASGQTSRISADPVAEMAGLRGRTNEKWRRHGSEVLPASIAEMDFPVATEVRAAIGARLAASDIGYAFSYTQDSPAQRAVSQWLTSRFDWPVLPNHIVFYADVMRVMEAGIEAFSAPGDAVVTDVPAYPSFFEAVRERGREIVGNPMVLRDGRWQVDLAGLERAFRDGARAYLLCSPHNPTGEVHSVAELTRIAELARAHRVTVLCDEVHSPLIYPGRRHVPFASLPAAREVRTLTAVSASKGWNIAGLKCAFGIPGDRAVAEALMAQPARMRDGVGILGAAASEAAFTVGDRWLGETMGYLDGNRRLLAGLIAAELPEIRHHRPESTYLAWLDCRRIADRLGEDDLTGRVLREANLAVTDGALFGSPGFLRLNFATPRPLVEETVRRLAVGLAATERPEIAVAVAHH
ncbi:aminotransferase class I/II-fold pyridoxal phosphate-dependent enzyme [Solihabitans fulvus]|uniref:cysteine-S-conjugate beta-lyase n=1 Tax=Solihabitans fulvus TaxID=1892852 RepID=A0A5B2X307_9PSEU|nr:aminotransferase class I/II-fold pyridoxal phosphate-dependent enzyme [Solihabitans fulvus]KAA2257569.1 aminotransferase class I/II-fold pyridoxal phosphate-dependent enzyme [Solihabitans fulvus]